MDREDALTRPGPLAAVLWLAVYLLVWVTGERFSTAYLGYGWQIVPWDVLSSDPFRSLWYLHIQPPGWNAVLGVSAWVSPLPDGITLQVVLAAFGVVLATASASVAAQLGLGRASAVAVGLAASLHPEVLRWAFEPTYELPVAALLMIVVWSVGRAASTQRPLLGVWVAVGVTAGVVMTRSLYHPVWLALVLALVLWLAREHLQRRQVLVAVLVPLLLIGGWMAKNQAVFGEATLSSWFGMNLQRAVIPVLDADDLLAMHTAGDVSDIAMIGPFAKYEDYAASMPPCTPRHGHRSVTEPMRTTDLYSPNFNYECYLPVFEQAGSDAWAVIRKHPGVWVEGRLWSVRTTFAVADQPRSSESPVMQALAWTYAVARVDVRFAISTESWGSSFLGPVVTRPPFGLVPVAMYLALAVLGAVHGLRLLRRRTGDPQGSAIVLVGAFVAVWTVVVGAVGELGEQARFRTMADPVVWTVVLALTVRWVTSARSAAPAGPGRSAAPGDQPSTGA